MTDDYISRVQGEARTAIHLLVKASGGGFTDRPLFRGEPHVRTIREPEPLAGIRAATAFEQEHRRRCLQYVRYAREDGLSWQQIGEALGFRADPGCGIFPAGQAFRHLASDLGSGSPSFGFTCGTCGRPVTDYGPEAGHPEDAERGHAAGCARLAATVAEWERNWADE